MIRSVSHAKTEAVDAHKEAKATFDRVQTEFNETEALLDKGRDFITNLTNVISNSSASPNEIKTIAEDVLKLDLRLDPDEIKHLANNIDQTVAQLENVESIIENTRHDLHLVEGLRNDSTAAK